MKKLIIAVVAALAIVLAFGACKKNDKPLVSPAPSSAAPAATAPAADPHATTTDPHAVSNVLVPAGVGHKGTVLDVVQAGEYTYIQVNENGKQLWVATVGAKAAKGDVIEFADAPVFPSFQSKALNRTFDNLMMVDGIRNDTQK
ncbi:MAG TPA: hypothetical protein VMV83_03325 [Rectinemataceae bacterium]|nr:hypothetical protein [Rectinemataceae bacterium]